MEYCSESVECFSSILAGDAGSIAGLRSVLDPELFEPVGDLLGEEAGLDVYLLHIP